MVSRKVTGVCGDKGSSGDVTGEGFSETEKCSIREEHLPRGILDKEKRDPSMGTP